MDPRIIPQWRVGDRVIALTQVLEYGLGDTYGPTALPYAAGWDHAEVGDLGTVVHAERGHFPTVRWDRTGTATCVSAAEAETTTESSVE